MVIINKLIFISCIAAIFSISFASAISGTQVYIQTPEGNQDADCAGLDDLLMNFDFDIRNVGQMSDQRCSLRGESGNLVIDGITFYNNNLNFYIPLKNGGTGGGTFNTQRGRNRFEFGFDVQQILEAKPNQWVILAKGSGKLNNAPLNFDEIIIKIDKNNDKVEIMGTGDKNFELTNMDIGFLRWCSGNKPDIFVLLQKERLNPGRTQEEMNELLGNNPLFVEAYQYKGCMDVPVVPEFGFYAGILTIIGAVGVMFLVRRK